MRAGGKERTSSTPSGNKVYGIGGANIRFRAPRFITRPKRCRDAGFKRWDVYSPFPIHGMDDAMGLGKSMAERDRSSVGGLTGFSLAVVLKFDPVMVHLSARSCTASRSTCLTVPAFFPIMFELTVLFSAFTAFFGMLIMNGLPRWNHPMFNWERFAESATTDSSSSIEAAIRSFTESDAPRTSRGHAAARHITLMHED